MDSGHQTVATNQLADDPIYQVLSVSVSRHPHSLSSCWPVFFTLYNYVTCSPQQLLTCQNKYLQLVKSNIQSWGLGPGQFWIWNMNMGHTPRFSFISENVSNEILPRVAVVSPIALIAIKNPFRHVTNQSLNFILNVSFTCRRPWRQQYCSQE